MSQEGIRRTPVLTPDLQLRNARLYQRHHALAPEEGACRRFGSHDPHELLRSAASLRRFVAFEADEQRASPLVQLVILLYLLDNNENTSWMILAGQGMGLAIEAWKITKAVDIKVVPDRKSVV